MEAVITAKIIRYFPRGRVIAASVCHRGVEIVHWDKPHGANIWINAED